MNHNLCNEEKNFKLGENILILSFEYYLFIVKYKFQNNFSYNQGFIQKKVPFTKISDLKTNPSTKIGDLKTNPSQKSDTLKRTLKLKIMMLYFILVLLQMSLLVNDLKIFTKLHFFTIA